MLFLKVIAVYYQNRKKMQFVRKTEVCLLIKQVEYIITTVLQSFNGRKGKLNMQEDGILMLNY
jgi:hypothetical protein